MSEERIVTKEDIKKYKLLDSQEGRSLSELDVLIDEAKEERKRLRKEKKESVLKERKQAIDTEVGEEFAEKWFIPLQTAFGRIKKFDNVTQWREFVDAIVEKYGESDE